MPGETIQPAEIPVSSAPTVEMSTRKTDPSVEWGTVLQAGVELYDDQYGLTPKVEDAATDDIVSVFPERVHKPLTDFLPPEIPNEVGKLSPEASAHAIHSGGGVVGAAGVEVDAVHTEITAESDIEPVTVTPENASVEIARMLAGAEFTSSADGDSSTTRFKIEPAGVDAKGRATYRVMINGSPKTLGTRERVEKYFQTKLGEGVKYKVF